MSILQTNPHFSWGNLWADLLKGAGRGLLEYDGSRAAQAALAGLEVFDEAQAQQRQQAEQGPGDGTDQDRLLKLLAAMSPAELAARLRLSPQERGAWDEEWAQVPTDVSRAGQGAPAGGNGEPPVATTPPPYTGRPIPINPFDRWHLQSVLPFGVDGSLNRPTYRR